MGKRIQEEIKQLRRKAYQLAETVDDIILTTPISFNPVRDIAQHYDVN